MSSQCGSVAGVCHLKTVDLDCPVRSPAWNIWSSRDWLELELGCSPEAAKGKTTSGKELRNRTSELMYFQ